MKRFIFILCLTSIVFSCNYFAKYVKAEGSLLTITNFDTGLGMTGINEIHGDFTTLDKEVFNALKGESGNYNIRLVYNNAHDEFGNKITRSHDLGVINATELSKYENCSYWVSNTGGTYNIISHFLHSN